MRIGPSLWRLALRIGLGTLLTLLLLLPCLVLQTAPTIPAAPPLPTAEGGAGGQLKALLLRNDPRLPPPADAGPAGWHLARGSSAELESLINQVAARVRPMTVRLALAPKQARVQLSLPLQWWQQGPWLNVDLTLQETTGWPLLTGIRIGHLPLPPRAVEALARRWLRHSLANSATPLPLDMIHHIGFARDQATLQYRWQSGSLSRLLGSWWQADDVQRLRGLHLELVRLSRDRPGSDGQPQSLLPLMHALLRPTPAALQDEEALRQHHRAALLILALHATGQHPARVLPQASPWPRGNPQVLTLGGREDFCQHFLVSAVLAIEGGGPLSEALGLLKELADTRGGSGFSFNDIAADLAGTRFGLLAKQHPARLQAALQAGLMESALMPRVDDLPEFLTEAAFQARYGGVGAPNYQAMMRDIAARVAALPLHRP